MNRLRARAVRAAAGIGIAVLATPAHAAGDLNLTPDPLTTVVMLVAFVLIIFPLNAMIFQPIFRAMDEREDRIAGARTRAAQIQEQAKEALERYEAGVRGAREETLTYRRAQLEAARGDLATTTRDAKEEAEREVVQAREEIEASLAGAREGMRASAEDLGRLSAERVLGRSLS